VTRIVSKIDQISVISVLNKAQHGFLKGLSTCSNLLEAFNDWTLSINDRNGVTVAYIDFAKAFDSLAHPGDSPAEAVWHIRKSVGNWIKNFLSLRCQVTRVDSEVSDACPLTSGIVQRSRLGYCCLLYRGLH